MNARSTRLALFALCGVCCALGVCGAKEASLSFDEAFSWKLIEGSSFADVVERTSRDVHPPFYYLLLHAWAQVFGTSPAALRSLSTLCAALCACAIYVLGRDVAASSGLDRADPGRARTAGLICAAMAVSNPSLAYFSQVARMYSLAALLSAVSGLLLLRVLTSDGRRRATWLGYCLATTALLYTHNYGLFVFASEGLFAAALLASRAVSRARNAFDRPALVVGFAAFGVVFAAYLPWLQILARQSAQVHSSYWIAAVDFAAPLMTWYELLFAPRTKPGPFGGHVWPLQCLLCALPAAVWALSLRGRTAAMNFLIVMALGPTAIALFVSACVMPILVARYLLVALPFFLASAGCLLAAVPDRALRSGMLAAVALHGAHAYYAALSSAVPISASGVARAAEFVQSRRQPGEQVLVAGPELYLRFQYYSRDRRQARLLAAPEDVNHYGGAPVLEPNDFFPPDALMGLDRRVWLVSWSANQFAPRGWDELQQAWRREGPLETFLDRQPGHNVHVARFIRSLCDKEHDRP